MPTGGSDWGLGRYDRCFVATPQAHRYVLRQSVVECAAERTATPPAAGPEHRRSAYAVAGAARSRVPSIFLCTTGRLFMDEVDRSGKGIDQAVGEIATSAESTGTARERGHDRESQISLRTSP